jgi:hypothetical protein
MEGGVLTVLYNDKIVSVFVCTFSVRRFIGSVTKRSSAAGTARKGRRRRLLDRISREQQLTILYVEPN